jgi:ABC-type nitrate/sulfonate/bicarbonate transport system substrate-binding protein
LTTGYVRGPQAAMYTTRDFLDWYPNTVRAVTNAIVEAQRWTAHATPEKVAAAVPLQYALAEKDDETTYDNRSVENADKR